MRRLVYLIAILAASCAEPSLAFAQGHRHAPRVRVDTLYGLPADAVAITYCLAEGDSMRVVEVVDMVALDDPAYLAEVRVHEGQHAKEMRANPALCNALPFQLLGMEARAYCAESPLAVAHGSPSDSVYFGYQRALLHEFEHTTVRPDDVRAAWMHECGRLLVGALPDGTSAVVHGP